MILLWVKCSVRQDCVLIADHDKRPLRDVMTGTVRYLPCHSLEEWNAHLTSRQTNVPFCAVVQVRPIVLSCGARLDPELGLLSRVGDKIPCVACARSQQLLKKNGLVK